VPSARPTTIGAAARSLRPLQLAWSCPSTRADASTPTGSIQTRARHYYPVDGEAADYDEDVLNTYTAGVDVDNDTPVGLHETEIGDALILRFSFDVEFDYRLHLWAFDEET
jgi:hypothetical protein